MTNEQDEVIIDSTENNEDVEIVLEDNTEETPSEVKVETKPEETAEAKRSRLKRQLEQHEKKMGLKKEEVKPITSVISTKDLVALMENKVAEEDIDEVENYAKYKGISISEALKSSVVKTLIAESQEKRNTANATNTGSSRKSPSKVSDEVLISKAQKGDMPESEEDMIRLIRARMGK